MMLGFWRESIIRKLKFLFSRKRNTSSVEVEGEGKVYEASKMMRELPPDDLYSVQEFSGSINNRWMIG